MSIDVAGKRLLVLGGTTASYDLVKNAKEMGVYTIVTDDCEDRISKKIADESAMVSTTDIDGLVELIKEKNIDGVMEISFVKGIGDTAGDIGSSTDRIGFVIAQADSAKEAVEICEKARNTIKITIE